MNKAIRSFHNSLLEHEAEVRGWWETVPERKKRDWLSAKAIYTHWDRSRRPPPPPSPPPPKPQWKKPPDDNAEVAALKEELAQAKQSGLPSWRSRFTG
jgi:hypothetical protein